MDFSFQHFWFILPTLIIQVLSNDIEELKMTGDCSMFDYTVHDVSDTKSYYISFEGTNPPERCREGFYQGLDGEVCVEAVEFDVKDCNIEINFSINTLTDYSCNLKPVGRKCTGYGDFLKIRLTTKYPRLDSYKRSSFKLHITQGNVRKDDAAPVTAIIMPILIIALVLVIIFSVIAIRRRSLQRLNLNAARGPQPQPQTHVVVYHHVVQPQGGAEQYRPNTQQPLIPVPGQHMNTQNYPPNQQQLSMPGYGQQTGVQYFPTNPKPQDEKSLSAPPPSYEEAKNYLV